jgi:predicted transcriptional regulator
LLFGDLQSAKHYGVSCVVVDEQFVARNCWGCLDWCTGSMFPDHVVVDGADGCVVVAEEGSGVLQNPIPQQNVEG